MGRDEGRVGPRMKRFSLLISPLEEQMISNACFCQSAKKYSSYVEVKHLFSSKEIASN